MKTYPLKMYQTLRSLLGYEDDAAQGVPLDEQEFWPIFQRGMEIRIGVK